MDHPPSSDCASVPDGGSSACPGHGTITIIDTSWGIPGLGPEGTIALGGMAMATAAMTAVAWRALKPGGQRLHKAELVNRR